VSPSLASIHHYDLIVIGSGPAGQKAAIQAAKGGLAVALCEQEPAIGGACVHYGTIPSKSLRERAVRRAARAGNLIPVTLDQSVSVAELIGEVGHVVRAHDEYMSAQLQRNGIHLEHGRASFESPTAIRVRRVGGGEKLLTAKHIVIATGSVPRRLPQIPVDHEYIYDSDSILALPYLPRSLIVLGGGVIACEYASIFALLGVRVTLVDRATRPLGFLDCDLSRRFLETFAAMGGTFLGSTQVTDAAFDGIAGSTVNLASGATLAADKVLCALGRVSQLAGLNLESTGVEVDERGLIQVNAYGQTCVPNIYAAGDVVGPPALASAAMEQGRRAACHMLGLDPGSGSEFLPAGIYSVPELAGIGLTETQARERYSNVVIGAARFAEIARGQISGTQTGYLKLVATTDRRIRGVHIAGDQATDLIHMGQMALIQQATLDVFIDNIFNFPTYGEAFRVAALDAAESLASLQPAQA